jgi:cobalt/nickel transport system permease protein
MADMRSKLREIYSLEQLSGKQTVIHRLHPLAKLIVTIVYIVCIAAHDRYGFFTLAPFLFYPFIVMALAEIPFSMIGKRALVALPFSLFAGISNLIFDREYSFAAGTFVITTGMLSCAAILLRTYLCVSAVLILVAVTPFVQLTGQLRRLHVPAFFVNLLEMIYRYIGVLLEEAQTMLTAYRLRDPGAKYPVITQMGSFIGQLFLRSADRAERVYQAMLCRGYTLEKGGWREGQQQKFRAADWIFLLAAGGSSLFFAIR